MSTTTDLVAALGLIDTFSRGSIGSRISEIEWNVKGGNGTGCQAACGQFGIDEALLTAAYRVKIAAGQINVLIHAVAGLILTSKILEPDEMVDYVSLGAGNTGREFDLETDRRVAEFKFIHWKGGPEAIRQNSLFKDYFMLAECKQPKRRELYVLGTDYPLRFLRGGRALTSVMSKNRALDIAFRERHGDRFKTVGEYYAETHERVRIVDATPFVPELASLPE